MHQALGIENLRLCDMPLFHYVEFAGIHTDPSSRCGGNRISKLAVRSDDRTAQTGGLSLGKDQVHPAAYSKQFKRGMSYKLR